MRRIKLSEKPAYAFAGSIIPLKILTARAMIAAAIMGRMLNNIATMVEINMVKRCHVEGTIERGGGINHKVNAKIASNTIRNVIRIQSPFLMVIIARERMKNIVDIIRLNYFE
jgi:hypothetical protein